MEQSSAYNRVRELVQEGKVEIDLVLASSRSCSTVICQGLSTIADYDAYFHEPLRIATKGALNDDVAIEGQSAQDYDPYQHMISKYQELSSGSDEPITFLVKEMVAGEEYKEIPDFSEQYKSALDDLSPLTQNAILITRHPVERLKSLNNVPDSDCVNSDIRLIFRENSEISGLKKLNGMAFIDVSETSQLYSNPEAFFDALVSDIGRQRVTGASIKHFDNSAIIPELIEIDSWAKDSFCRHEGFALKPADEIGQVLCVESEELAQAIEGYYTDIYLD